MELDDSVEELEPLSFILGRLLDQLCARLNARALAVQLIHVRFELEPAFENGIQRLSKESTRSSAQKPAAKTHEKILTLPVPIRNSKTLLKLLRLNLQSHPPGAPILKVSLRAEPAAPRSVQGGLFAPVSPDPEKLELTVARLTNFVGDGNVGSPELVDTHRPGEFRMVRFRPSDISDNARKFPTRVQSKKATSSDNDSESNHGEGQRRPLTAFRTFRPAPSAKVDLQNARPVRVAFNGQLATVITISGPWRSSGDWWREDTWQRDEWDLELRFEPVHETARKSARRVRNYATNLAPQIPPHGVYCVYFDATRQSWFIRGVYD